VVSSAAAVGGSTTKTGGTTPTASASAEVGTKTLRRGDRGPRVVALQELLVTVGFKTETNGVYGTATVKTVRKFQRASTLTVNGVANPTTLERLKQAAGSATSTQAANGGGAEAGAETLRPEHLGDRIPLKPGMSGQDVRVMQSFLRKAGFKAKVNGDFDKRTVRHVKAFERANESPAVDGTMDANELAILRADVEGGDDPVNDADATRTIPGEKAKLGSDGLAIAPESAPDAVKQVIAAGNRIAKKPNI